MTTPQNSEVWEESFNKEFGVSKGPGRLYEDETFPCEGGYCETSVYDIKAFISKAIASAVEAREREISEAVKEMKSSVEKAGIKKQWEVTDEDRSSGSYNYIESGFLGGYQTAKQDILSIINPSKE